MAWTTPLTAVAGAMLPAADFNRYVRDNLNELAPALATTPGSIFAVSGTNQIAERIPQAYSENSTATITATSYGNPATGTAGPSVTVTTGIHAIIGYRAYLHNPSATARVEASYEISGATTRAASDNYSIGYSQSNSTDGLNLRAGGLDLATGLTPGVNTFTLKYLVSSGTGITASRRIWVLPL